MALNDAPVRGENWALSFAPEVTYGTSQATAYLVSTFGVVQTATMPDPEIDWASIWALGNASYRNFYINYRGKLTLSGSVPDIWLLNGAPMHFPIGRVSTTGTDAETGAGTLNGAHAAGVTSIILSDAAGYENDEYIQIDVNSATTTAEVRKITSIAGAPTLVVDYPLLYSHLTAAACNEVIAPYTHIIHETSQLGSLSMQHEMFDASGNSELIRRWSGGKVGRATYTASEGEQLRMSLDEMIFRSVAVDEDAGIAAATLQYPTTEPYIFSYGALTLWGTEFARVKSFSLEVSNNLEPKYYVTDDANDYLPYEIIEGRREYRLGVTIDITDSTMFDELVKYGTNQGVAVDGLFKGFDASMVLTRAASDTITFTLPPSSAAAGGDAQGCFIRSAPHNLVGDPQVAIDLDIIARSAQITVVDSVNNWFYNVV